LAELGCTPAVVRTYRERGIAAAAAARLAAEVGCTPEQLWPTWVEDLAAAEADRRRRTATDPAAVGAGLALVLHRIRAHQGDSPLSGTA
jgi:hypothetical protein